MRSSGDLKSPRGLGGLREAPNSREVVGALQSDGGAASALPTAGDLPRAKRSAPSPGPAPSTGKCFTGKRRPPLGQRTPQRTPLGQGKRPAASSGTTCGTSSAASPRTSPHPLGLVQHNSFTGNSSASPQTRPLLSSLVCLPLDLSASPGTSPSSASLRTRAWDAPQPHGWAECPRMRPAPTSRTSPTHAPKTASGSRMCGG